MAATITRLRTRQDRLREDQASQLRELVLSLPDLPKEPVSSLLGALDRLTASKGKWAFVMLNPEQNAAVVAWIMGNSARPMKAARAWAECFTVLRPDTGEIDARREELADRIGVPPAEISRIMGELETCGAIIRKRERVPGMRGAGIVRYFMNPRVGTHLAGAARDEAQAAAPRLRLVEG